MPRDSSGNYTVPSAVNPVVSGTPITDEWANTTLADVATGITDSLDRQGRGGMLGAFKITDGTAAAPGLGFTNESSSGMFRPSASVLAWSILGTERMRITATGVSITGTLSATGAVTLPADTTIGNVSATELSHLDGVNSPIQTQLNAKAPAASPTFTGTVTLPADTTIGNISATELGYLDGVNSPIQTQLDAKAPLASPTFTGTVTLPVTSTVDGFSVGYRSLPVVSTSGTTAATTAVGKCYATTGDMTFNGTTFDAGNIVSVYNNSASSITITQGSALTLRLAGTNLTGNRNLAPRGMATVLFLSGTEAVISGAGVN